MEDKTIREYLVSFDVKFIIMDMTTCEMEKKWEEHFLSNVSIEDKEAIHIYDVDDNTGNMWHGFSYDMVPHLMRRRQGLNLTSKRTMV